VRDNDAAGIWFDIGCQGALVDGNMVVDNANAGIYYEISYGALIRGNRVERNGGASAGPWLGHAGIQVSNSPDVEIVGNTVLDNANGITAMQAAGYPTTAAGETRPLVVENLFVHHNLVRMAVGNTGIAENVGDQSVFTNRNNRFEHNTYDLGVNAGYFAWAGSFQLSVASWRSHGQDLAGSFNR
jgi:parallel beta-helix repeat protein